MPMCSDCEHWQPNGAEASHAPCEVIPGECAHDFWCDYWKQLAPDVTAEKLAAAISAGSESNKEATLPKAKRMSLETAKRKVATHVREAFDDAWEEFGDDKSTEFLIAIVADRLGIERDDVVDALAMTAQ